MIELRLKDVLPDIFKKPASIVEKGTRILVAGTMLDIPKRDVLPIASSAESKQKNVLKFLTDESKRNLAFSGYSLSAKIVSTTDFYNLLFQPCENAAMLVQPIDNDNPELESVLDVFARDKFGWAFVEQGDGIFGVVTLSDLLPLYDSGVLHSEYTFHEVASSDIFSMPRDTTLEEALREMMKRRIRRVFITGADSFVSDREILRFLFSVERLAQIKDSPGTALEATLQEVGPVEPVQIHDGTTKLDELATLIGHGSGEPCATCDGELVTPWDLIVTPWKAGRLEIVKMARNPQDREKRKELQRARF